ncbi:MAG: DUF1499 domain-containing protein [Pseudomonadota bacterium]
MFLWILFALGAALVAVAVLIRVAPDDPARWHVDPADVVEQGAQNDFIVHPGGEGADIASPVFDKTPEELLAAFTVTAMAAPRTTLLSDEGGFATFIQRTALVAFPDYVSVRAVAVEGGSALHIYSRSRYGIKDFNVNKARVSAWLKKL